MVDDLVLILTRHGSQRVRNYFMRLNFISGALCHSPGKTFDMKYVRLERR